MSCFDLTHAPVATAARAAATGLVSMSTRPDPEGCCVGPTLVGLLLLAEHGSCLARSMEVRLRSMTFLSPPKPPSTQQGHRHRDFWLCRARRWLPPNFTRRDERDRALSIGAATVHCERDSTPRSRGGFDVFAALRNERPPECIYFLC